MVDLRSGVLSSNGGARDFDPLVEEGDLSEPEEVVIAGVSGDGEHTRCDSGTD